MPLSLSTLADEVGACCAVLERVFKCIETHVFAAGRLHDDDATVPVLSASKTDIVRSWVYVRDDRLLRDNQDESGPTIWMRVCGRCDGEGRSP